MIGISLSSSKAARFAQMLIAPIPNKYFRGCTSRFLHSGEAVVKSYALPGEDNKPFLAYLIPKDTDASSVVDNDVARYVASIVQGE